MQDCASIHESRLHLLLAHAVVTTCACSELTTLKNHPADSTAQEAKRSCVPRMRPVSQPV